MDARQDGALLEVLPYAGRTHPGCIPEPETETGMKHAFLILAHHEFGLLQTLIGCLDDVRNDIYVHIDRKAGSLPELHAERAGMHVLRNRVDVRWGDYSVVEAEFVLFGAALENGPYAYYHLLSGVDLPIKSQDYIHRFFEEHQGKEFIGYTLTHITPEIERKVRRWHLFPGDFKNQSAVKHFLRTYCIHLQEILGIRRNRRIDFKKGSQWVSVTEAMVRCFLDHRAWARKVFRHTFCSDEIIFQTLCWESPMRDCLYDTARDGIGCMRNVGWKEKNGTWELADWTAEDYASLASDGALFARKFNSSDPDFIQRIVALAKP